MNREILPSMLERNRGQIVAMSSMSSMSGVAGISTYSVTKWGLNGKYLLELYYYHKVSLCNSNEKRVS